MGPFYLGEQDYYGYLVLPSDQPHCSEPEKDTRGAAVILHPSLAEVYRRAPEATHRSISDHLSAVTLPLDEVFSPSRCRTLAASKTLIIIAAYAPHMGHHKGKARNVKRFYTNLAKFEAELLQDDPKTVIIMGGDFNARVKQDAPYTRHPAVGPYSGSLIENENGWLLLARTHGLATNFRKQKHIGHRKDNALTISSSTTRSRTPALSWTCARVSQ